MHYGAIGNDDISIWTYGVLTEGYLRNAWTRDFLPLPTAAASIVNNPSSFDNTDAIGASAFANQTLCKEAVIPFSVTSVGYDAFKNCGQGLSIFWDYNRN